MTDEPVSPAGRFLPGAVQIQSFGNGGFRFGEMSHRGSLLGLPSGMHAWPVTVPAEITEASLAGVLAEADRIDFLLLGTGPRIEPIPETLRWRLREAGMSVETMSTASAARTWNVVLAEGRRVAVAMIAVA